MQDRNLIRISETLMRIRPTQVGALLKVAFGLTRRVMNGPNKTRYFADPVSLLGLELLKHACYEPEMTRLVESMLRPGDTFVDLGANEGYFSVIAGKIVAHGKVVAIEPQSRLRPVLARNLELNDLCNISICQAAIADHEGTAALALRPTTHTGASSMFPYWRIGWRKEKVRTLTLDRLLEEYVITDAALMKVDCEGAEKLIFSGSIDALSKHRIRAIVLEYHPQIIGPEACRSIHQTMENLGYRAMKWRDLNIYLAPTAAIDRMPSDATANQSILAG